MLQVERKETCDSVKGAIVQWIEREGGDEDEQLRVLAECQKALIQALSSLCGNFGSLTYRLTQDAGQLVCLYFEDNGSFSMNFRSSDSTPEDQTQFLETHFPFPALNENPVRYHYRLLEGIEAFVDQIAIAELVEVGPKH